MMNRVASTIWGSFKALLFISLLWFGPIFLMVLRANLMRERILCRTDHQALLAAGQEMRRKAAQEHQDSGDLHADSSRRSGGTTRLPRVMRDLGARSVFIERDGHLRIMMHGGMTGFGFDIYTEDFKEPFAGFPLRSLRWISGIDALLAYHGPSTG